MLNLSLSGCGFLGIYHVGVISAFREHGDPCFLDKISGCSAGSLVAACALCDCCLGQMVSDVLEIALKARSHALGPLHPSFNIVEILKNGLRRILPVDAHKICSGRLHVSLTRWKDGKNVIVNQFDSREELIQALICSSFIPCYSGFIPPKFKGVYYWDGGLTNNNPVLDQDTILVAPFGGESDICPRDESASFYCTDFQGTNVQWSYENIYRVSKALFPPHPEILKAVCFRGYKDGVNFLKSRNLLQCSCNFSREKTSISSVIGEDLSALPIFDNELDTVTIYDSEDDQIIQYADSNAPLNYKEMPTSVCDILDAACEDNKGILNSVYDSQISRAISIMFLPWTLPVEFSLGFTKKLLELLPTIKVSQNPSNLVDSVLIYLNFLIQKLTYDKYQYHTRVTCKLCVPRRLSKSNSNNQNIQIKICCHSNANKMICNDSESEKNGSIGVHQHQHTLSYPKLCARHRVPSVCSSEGFYKYKNRGNSSVGNQTTADLNEFSSTSKLRTRRKKTLSNSSRNQSESSLKLGTSKRNSSRNDKLNLDDEPIKLFDVSKPNKTHSKVHFHLNTEEDMDETKLHHDNNRSTDSLIINDHVKSDVIKKTNLKTDYSNTLRNLTDDIKTANQYNCSKKDNEFSMDKSNDTKLLDGSTSSTITNEDDSKSSKLDSYWEKFESNVFGNINT